jgi:hypothetical protein
MLRENAGSVAEGLRLALERYGLPGQVLTDNGKVFTGRFNQPPVEMLFDRILYDGDQLLRTQLRRGSGQVRKKRPSVPGGRSTVKTSVTHHPE